MRNDLDLSESFTWIMYLKIPFISSLIHSWNNGHPSHVPAENNNLFNLDDFPGCQVQTQRGKWDLAIQLGGSTLAAIWFLWWESLTKRTPILWLKCFWCEKFRLFYPLVKKMTGLVCKLLVFQLFRFRLCRTDRCAAATCPLKLWKPMIWIFYVLTGVNLPRFALP